MYGVIVSGDGAASEFVAREVERLAGPLGFRPFEGTLNIMGTTEAPALEALSVSDVGNEHCNGVDLKPCRLDGVRAAIVRPHVPDYPAEKTELLAPVRLRSLFQLRDGDDVQLTRPGIPWPETDRRVPLDEIDAFDAVVFDLDNTLLDLAVDWDAVREEIESLLDDIVASPLVEYDRNELFDLAREHGLYDEYCALLGDHERDGALDAVPRPPLAALDSLTCPVGVCTANAVEAAEIALEESGVIDRIDTIVGRETLREQKPHPRPLARCVTSLNVRPGNAVFVGDERTDAEAAYRAGTSFLRPEQIQSKSS